LDNEFHNVSKEINDHSADNLEPIPQDSLHLSTHSNERWLNHALESKPTTKHETKSKRKSPKMQVIVNSKRKSSPTLNTYLNKSHHKRSKTHKTEKKVEHMSIVRKLMKDADPAEIEKA
jgi:hypothetical protein